MATSSAAQSTANAANGRVTLGTSATQELADEIDKLVARWNLPDRAHVIRYILSAAAWDEATQRAIRIAHVPVALPLAQKYRVVRGGVVRVLDGGASYGYREYSPNGAKVEGITKEVVKLIRDPEGNVTEERSTVPVLGQDGVQLTRRYDDA